MSDVVLEPAVRQLELLRSGAISVLELAEAHIRQIERLNPKPDAWWTSMRIGARAGATA